MSRSSEATRFSSFQRLAVATTAITYFLILVGGLVRASGAGLGCPDWPRCFGSWIPPASAADLPSQFDASQFNPMLMWTEYLNRLLGVTVGFLIFATAISAFRNYRRTPAILWSVIAALLLTGYEGWLGGRVVAYELAPWIVTAHLVVALIIVSLLLYATVMSFAGVNQSGRPRLFSSTQSRMVLMLIVVTLVQIGIGTQVRGRVDSALDASVPRSEALSTVGFVDGLHRDAALVVFAFTLFVCYRVWMKSADRSVARYWAAAVVGLAVVQIAIGVVMAYVSLAPAAQVSHLAVASLLLGAETVLLLVGVSE